MAADSDPTMWTLPLKKIIFEFIDHTTPLVEMDVSDYTFHLDSGTTVHHFPDTIHGFFDEHVIYEGLPEEREVGRHILSRQNIEVIRLRFGNSELERCSMTVYRPQDFLGLPSFGTDDHVPCAYVKNANRTDLVATFGAPFFTLVAVQFDTWSRTVKLMNKPYYKRAQVNLRPGW
ncbi:hypothetical protein EV421DRAFT_764003 [Armillaria borealis]|uniref:Uncharacterized protein n=1 Tax=Armillaria borealis TaxID=47425 RepID=A0AA39MNG6_9AGAR|nr:hypothetical protein EV421DRAFT_764003 [Armillaria borealis]